MRPLTLISDPATVNAALEVWYIQNRIAGGLPYTLTQDAGHLQNGVVIYMELGGADLNFIKSLKSRNNRVVLFQMGDEYGKKTREAYDLCDGVIRNYFFQDVFEEPRTVGKIFWVPNGFRSGVGPREFTKLKPTTQRSYLASFMGWLSNTGSYNNERALFQAQVQNCQPHLFVNPSAGFAGGFNIGLYSTVLESSIFCPCPAGNAPESIRLYDVLEMGAIPIALRNDYIDSPFALGGVPFPIIEKWEDLPAFLAEQNRIRQTQPERLLDLQRTCIDWWQMCQNDIASRIGHFLFDLRTRP
jgi:hypothetical protein